MKAETYATSDIALAAYFISKGYKIVDVDTATRGRSWFVVEETEHRIADMFAFFNRKASVEPVAFLENLKNLKAMATSK